MTLYFCLFCVGILVSRVFGFSSVHYKGRSNLNHRYFKSSTMKNVGENSVLDPLKVSKPSFLFSGDSISKARTFRSTIQNSNEKIKTSENEEDYEFEVDDFLFEDDLEVNKEQNEMEENQEKQTLRETLLKINDYLEDNDYFDTEEEKAAAAKKTKFQLGYRNPKLTTKNALQGKNIKEEDDKVSLSLTNTFTIGETQFMRLQPSRSHRKSSPLPVIAVIGRPNVGKSTIVNRLTRGTGGKKKMEEPEAIVHDEEGVTRDRIYRRGEWDGIPFDMVDTGGLVFDEDPDHLFAKQIHEQALIALEEACAAILVVDGRTGPTTLDETIAKFLKRNKKNFDIPIYLAVNKCESPVDGDLFAANFWSLGLGNPYPVSGIHGFGMMDLMEDLQHNLFKVEEYKEDNTINVAIIGRPNVGKSSLLNRFYGEERAIVSDVAGTTRDAIDALVEIRPITSTATRKGKQSEKKGEEQLESMEEKETNIEEDTEKSMEDHNKDQEDTSRYYRFIDTAGIRRKKKIEYGSEFFMINRAFKAIRRADIVLLTVDVTEGILDQDRILAQRIADEGRACIVVANKWDAVADKDDSTYNKAIEYIKDSLFPVSWAPIMFTSAITGQRCQSIFENIDNVLSKHKHRVTTAILNEVLADAVAWQRPPSSKGGKQGKVYYCNQVSTSPPTIVVMVNDPKLFGEGYRRYLDRKFRENINFEGTPIRWLFRGKRLRQIEREANKSTLPYGNRGM